MAISILGAVAQTNYPTGPSVGTVSTTPSASVLSPGVRATASVVWSLATNPSDGQTVTINDGTRTVVFEFDSNGSVVQTATLRQVVIGGNLAATIVTLTAAINALQAAGSLNCTAVAAAQQCDLTHTAFSSAPNGVAVTTTATNAVNTSWAGGVNPGVLNGRLVRVLAFNLTAAAAPTGTLTFQNHALATAFSTSNWLQSYVEYGPDGILVPGGGLAIVQSAVNMNGIVHWSLEPA